MLPPLKAAAVLHIYTVSTRVEKCHQTAWLCGLLGMSKYRFLEGRVPKTRNESTNFSNMSLFPLSARVVGDKGTGFDLLKYQFLEAPCMKRAVFDV